MPMPAISPPDEMVTFEISPAAGKKFTAVISKPDVESMDISSSLKALWSQRQAERAQAKEDDEKSL